MWVFYVNVYNKFMAIFVFNPRSERSEKTMKVFKFHVLIRIVFIVFISWIVNISATSRYVSYHTNYTGPSTLYNTPSTAATNIQIAYNACSAGDEIVIIDNYSNYPSCLFNTTGSILIYPDEGYRPAIRILTGQVGIEIRDANYISVKGLLILGITNDTIGASINDADYSTFSNCIFISNDIGVYFDNSWGASLGARIINNEFREYTIGIDFFQRATYNLIEENSFIRGKEKGIWIRKNFSRLCQYNFIINNTFVSNGTYNISTSYPAGIYIQETHNNIIQKNLMIYNGNGLVFDGICMGNQVLNNTFFENTRFIIPDTLHHSGIEFYQCNDNSNLVKGNISCGNNYGYYSDSILNQNITYNLAYNNGIECSSYINNGDFTSGEGCIVGDPAFKDSKNTDFNLKFYSEAIRSSFSNLIEQSSMGRYTISLESLSSGMNVVTTNIIRFTTHKSNESIPGNGKIKIVYPDGFGISGVTDTDISSTTMDGLFITSVSGQTLILTRSAGTGTIAGKTEAIAIKNITNCNFSSGTNFIQLAFFDSSGNQISDFEDSNDFFIGTNLLLLNSTPLSNEYFFPLNDNCVLTFNDEIKTEYMNTNHIYILDEYGSKLPCSFFKIDQTNILVVPLVSLEPNHFYELFISIVITSINGYVLQDSYYIPFYSNAGVETVHQYNSISCDGNGNDWITTNIVHYAGLRTELLTNDTGDNTPVDAAITNLWVTWDSTNIYFRLDKNNGATGFFGNTFQDYIFLDLTHDYSGASSSTYDGHTINFSDKAKPDFRIYVFDQWTGGYSAGLVCEKWNGSSWIDAGISKITWQGIGTPPYNFILELGVRADFLTNHAVNATDSSPNRIKVLAYSKWTANSTAIDFCPEDQSFIDITPDNNNDNVLDKRIIPPSPSFVLYKSISNIVSEYSLNKPVPGALIIYRIMYSNTSLYSASNVIINDRLPACVTFVSNSVNTNLAPGEWIAEFSTNLIPIQSYISINYLTNDFGLRVKWLRFKKKMISASETGIFFYSVLVK